MHCCALGALITLVKLIYIYCNIKYKKSIILTPIENSDDIFVSTKEIKYEETYPKNV